jgi:hypothetical protein
LWDNASPGHFSVDHTASEHVATDYVAADHTASDHIISSDYTADYRALKIIMLQLIVLRSSNRIHTNENTLV